MRNKGRLVKSSELKNLMVSRAGDLTWLPEYDSGSKNAAGGLVDGKQWIAVQNDGVKAGVKFIYIGKTFENELHIGKFL